jgi:hypothetical protein
MDMALGNSNDILESDDLVLSTLQMAFDPC